MENNALKTVLLVLLIIYILSPVDALPGPVDDLIFLIAYMGADR